MIKQHLDCRSPQPLFRCVFPFSNSSKVNKSSNQPAMSDWPATPTIVTLYAGVIPFAKRLEDGAVVVLLGREAFGKDRGTWSGFGGGAEQGEHGQPHDTAAREAFEESMGLLGTRLSIWRQLGELAPSHVVSKEFDMRGSRRRASTHHFLLNIPYWEDFPRAFAGTRDAMMLHKGFRGSTVPRDSGHCLEKDAVAWFPMKELIAAEGGDGPVRFRYGFRRDMVTIASRIHALTQGRTSTSTISSPGLCTGPTPPGPSSSVMPSPDASCTART